MQHGKHLGWYLVHSQYSIGVHPNCDLVICSTNIYELVSCASSVSSTEGRWLAHGVPSQDQEGDRYVNRWNRSVTVSANGQLCPLVLGHRGRSDSSEEVDGVCQSAGWEGKWLFPHKEQLEWSLQALVSRLVAVHPGEGRIREGPGLFPWGTGEPSVL